jgi:hypothetical protein
MNQFQGSNLPDNREAARASRVGALALVASAALLLAVGGCESEHHDHASHMHSSPATVTGGTTLAGHYAISWTSTPDPVVVGEVFALDTTVTHSDGAALPAGATLTVDAWMPEHGHGMEGVTPVTTEKAGAPGHFRTDGMRFQMPGQWQLKFKVDAAAGLDELTLNIAAP